MLMATLLRPPQSVAAKVQLDIRANRMLGAPYTKVPDFLVFVH